MGYQKLRQRTSIYIRLVSIHQLYTAVSILAIGILAAYFILYPHTGPYLLEDISYVLHPSASAAFALGEKHFNNTAPDAYDLNRAEYFFHVTAAIDLQYPYVYHELARISFLRGDFDMAMTQIDEQIKLHGDSEPNSYYVRGLIEGFKGDYVDSEQDYAHFLQFDPDDWAGVNDYAWVLLKDNKPGVAAAAIAKVLPYFQSNPWLLNSDAIALYETGNTTAALTKAQAALQAVDALSPEDWAHAYPGNDFSIAAQGLSVFKAAVLENVHTIESGKPASTLQS